MPAIRLLICLAVVASLTRSVSGAAPDTETRAIWVTRWDFRTARDVRTIFENCSSLGLNRVYFQVRGRGDAFYRSPHEPWAEELGGRDPGYDPLALAVTEAHRRGIELHAWINVLAGWKGRTPPRDHAHIYHLHPDWFLLDRYGKRHLLSDHYTIVNPCRPEVRQHLARVVADIAGRYSVDGMHLDYIRFIATGARDRQAVPYDNKTLHIFRQQTGGFPVRHPDAWDAFRRDAVSTLVRDLSATARKARPGLNVSAAVVRDFERASDLYFQDAPSWVRQGWIDELVPMIYEESLARFTQHTRASMAKSGDGNCIPGIGVYMFSVPEDLIRQIGAARQLGQNGYALFAYASFFPTPSHATARGRKAVELRARMRTALRRLNQDLVSRLKLGARAVGVR